MCVPAVLALVALVSAQEPVAAPPDAKGKALRIGLASLEVHDVEPRVAAVVEDSLLAEMRKLQRTSVIGMKEIRQMLDLEAEKQTLGCSGESQSCLAEIADAIGVDILVVGTIAKVGDEEVFGLKRIEQRAAIVGNTVTKRVPAGDGEELLALVGAGIAELFPEVPLRPGAVRGVSQEAARRLNPPPLPWPTPFIVGGAAGVALLGAGGAAVLWRVNQGAYTEQAKADLVDGKALVQRGHDTQTAEIAMWSLLGATAALGIATAVTIPFTNFAPDEVTR